MGACYPRRVLRLPFRGPEKKTRFFPVCRTRMFRHSLRRCVNIRIRCVHNSSYLKGLKIDEKGGATWRDFKRQIHASLLLGLDHIKWVKNKTRIGIYIYQSKRMTRREPDRKRGRGVDREWDREDENRRNKAKDRRQWRSFEGKKNEKKRQREGEILCNLSSELTQTPQAAMTWVRTTVPVGAFVTIKTH